MSRVITFSTKFPYYHPYKGQETQFVVAIAAGLMVMKGEHRLSDFHHLKPKFHTIRRGHRFKKGDMFSPRIWSGRPYNSPQTTLFNDFEVKKTWDFEIIPKPLGTLEFLVDKELAEQKLMAEIIKNDGLSEFEFYHWFKLKPEYGEVKHFDGQIICWNDKIEY